MNHDAYVFAATAALILFALYRRFRRLFGRQPLQPARLKARVVILSVVSLLLAVRGLQSANLALAGFGGAAAGAALAYLGLRLTRFDATPNGIFYTPNRYIGAILSALLLSRLAYRFGVLYPAMQAAHASSGDPFAGYRGSALTVALFGVVIAYYIAYYAGLLIRSAELRPVPVTAQSRDAASPPSGP
jgi:hypothetical protein